MAVYAEWRVRILMPDNTPDRMMNDVAEEAAQRLESRLKQIVRENLSAFPFEATGKVEEKL